LASSPRTALIAVVLGAGLLVGAGCGSDDGPTTSSTPAVLTGVTTPAAATPTVTAEAGVPTATTGVPTRTEADAGDEEGIRVPAAFTLADGTFSPGQITVPPQLPIAVTVTAKDGAAHKILFNTKPVVRVDIEAGGDGVGTARIPGQRKGTYTASIDGGAPAPALVAVDDAGP